MKLRTALTLAACLTAVAIVIAAPVLTESLNGRQVFPVTNWWNLDVSGAPVDARSAQFIDWISGRTPSTPTATRRLHPDFGPPPTAFPTSSSTAAQPRVPVTFEYGDESDAGIPGLPGYPIPDEARTQPNYIEGGVAGRWHVRRPSPAHDRPRSLAALRDVRDALERARRALGSRLGRDLQSRHQRSPAESWTSADAAGLAIFPGLVRYDEVYGTERDHACVPRHDAGDQRLRLARVAPRRLERERAADRRAAAAQGRARHLRLHAGDAAASSAR